MKITCKHCGLEIAKIIDPWGYDQYHGKEFGWYHVEATDNSDGRYVTACPIEECDGFEAEPSDWQKSGMAAYEDAALARGQQP